MRQFLTYFAQHETNFFNFRRRYETKILLNLFQAIWVKLFNLLRAKLGKIFNLFHMTWDKIFNPFQITWDKIFNLFQATWDQIFKPISGDLRKFSTYFGCSGWHWSRGHGASVSRHWLYRAWQRSRSTGLSRQLNSDALYRVEVCCHEVSQSQLKQSQNQNKMNMKKSQVFRISTSIPYKVFWPLTGSSQKRPSICVFCIMITAL